MTRPSLRHLQSQEGFTLFEIILVISLMVFVFAIVIPQFSMRTGADAQTKVGRLQADIRAAFDMAVLTRKPYRIVFSLASGEYWLEEADKSNFYLGDEKLNRDLTAEEEKDIKEDFDAGFKEYEDLAGEVITDSEDQEEIPPTSPLLQAKEKLRRAVWSKVDSLDWRERGIGPTLIFRDVQAEHHASKQSFQELGEKAQAMLYFFPSGYVERAVIHLAFRKGDLEFDDKQEGYTISTNSYTGVAEAAAGTEEIDISHDNAKS